MLRAIIFDFDGVIADTERLHLQGFRLALDAYDISIPEQHYLARYLGLDDRDGFEAILGDNGIEAEGGRVIKLMENKARIFRDLVGQRVSIFPGVTELIDDLRASPQNLSTAIGSGALRDEIRLILKVSQLDGCFDEIVSADDVARGKPDPEIFLEACERLATRAKPGLTPADCLVIEDSIGGIEAGRRAGMKTVAVTNSYAAHEFEHADLVVSSLAELNHARCANLVAE
jgi:beta-phosphoglucomutase